MIVIKGDNFANVYARSLNYLIKDPDYIIRPKGIKVKEIQNIALIIKDPRYCLYSNPRRSSRYKYIAAELLWYFTGRSDLKFIENYASYWRQIVNQDQSVNSAYGNLIFTQKNEYGITQWQWAIQSLIRDKDTRQSVLLFNKPQYQYYNNKDFICTLSGIFTIRNNKLNFTINMRSNDVILGTPTDIVFFCLLQQQAHKLLKKYYPDLELGQYTHIVNSFHLYEKHFDLAKEMIDLHFIPEKMPEINENLIDINGSPSQKLIELINCVEYGCNFESSDSLLTWIYNKIKQ